MIFLAGAGAILWSALFVRVTLVLMRMYQLEEYDARRIIRWALITPTYFRHRAWLGAAVVQIAGFALALILHSRTVGAAGFVGSGLVANGLWRWATEKKGLVLTTRAHRLLAVTRGVSVCICVAMAVDGAWDPIQLAMIAGVVLAPTVVLGC